MDDEQLSQNVVRRTDLLHVFQAFLPKPPSNRIAVADLHSYLQNPANIQAIRDEFESIGYGVYTYKEEGRKPQHVSKNRVECLVPYDSNRVVLETLEDDPDSDYYNASFIDGYKSPKKYIAAAGPVRETVVDFWRMIWQEKVTTILMITELVDSIEVTVRCAKYWPEHSETYGSFTVQVQETKNFDDFTIRTLRVCKGDEIRQVHHYAYCVWHDMGAPTKASSLIKLLEEYRSQGTNENNAPILVHCSAGVSRTGTAILLDTMLDMAENEKAIDMPAYLWSLRKQRFAALTYFELYLFVYRLLADYTAKKQY